MANSAKIEVTYIRPGSGEPFVVRHTTHYADQIIRNAKTLGAIRVVCVDGRDDMRDLLIWAVFDVRRSTKVFNGEFSMPVPERSFVAETSDAAVMWAIAQGDR